MEGVEWDFRLVQALQLLTSSSSNENRSLHERSKKASIIEYHRSAGEKVRHAVASGSTYLDLDLANIGRLETLVTVPW